MHISDVHVYTAVNFIVPRTNKTVSCYAVVIEPQPTVDNKEQVDFKVATAIKNKLVGMVIDLE